MYQWPPWISMNSSKRQWQWFTQFVMVTQGQGWFYTCAQPIGETALLCNDISHWLGASLESTLRDTGWTKIGGNGQLTTSFQKYININLIWLLWHQWIETSIKLYIFTPIIMCTFNSQYKFKYDAGTTSYWCTCCKDLHRQPLWRLQRRRSLIVLGFSWAIQGMPPRVYNEIKPQL